ncbi:hypothetical protein MTBGP_07210 [Moorella thermoacetica]
MVVEKLPSFFIDEQKNLENIKAQYEKQIQDLYAEVGRLTTELTWLKKRVASEFNRDERISMVEWGHHELSIKKQAELLSLNCSSLYYQPVSPSPEEIAIKHRIDEIYTALPFYGSRRITAQLRKEGFWVNRKAVQHHMRGRKRLSGDASFR